MVRKFLFEIRYGYGKVVWTIWYRYHIPVWIFFSSTYQYPYLVKVCSMWYWYGYWYWYVQTLINSKLKKRNRWSLAALCAANGVHQICLRPCWLSSLCHNRHFFHEWLEDVPCSSSFSKRDWWLVDSLNCFFIVTWSWVACAWLVDEIGKKKFAGSRKFFIGCQELIQPNSFYLSLSLNVKCFCFGGMRKLNCKNQKQNCK